MKSSYRIFRIKGIEIRLHFTLIILFLLPVLELTSFSDLAEGAVSAIYSFAFLFALFSSVLAHELTHSIVAMRNGTKVKQIILWPLGGIASVGIVKDPVKELKISIAGPMASLAIGFSLLLLLVAVEGTGLLWKSIASGEFLATPSLLNFIAMAMYVNFVLGIFNLFLPIFPMDGGRVLRSMLNMVTTRIRATQLAVGIGQAFLAVFVVFALMAGSLWLIIMGVFLFIAGLSELRFTELSDLAEKADLGKTMRTSFIAVHPSLKVADFLQIAVPWQSLYPVLDETGKPVGIIEPERLENKAGAVSDVMGTEFPAIRLDGDRDNAISSILSNNYALVVGKEGALHGIITLQDLQRAIKLESIKAK